MITKAPKTLPPNVILEDLQYNFEDRIGWDSEYPVVLTLHLVQGEWMIATLHISNPNRKQLARGIDTARTYAISVLNGKIYTVGKGPHVKETIEVHVKKSNVDRIKNLLVRYQEGLEAAGRIRDRRSSRIAQGRLYRASLYDAWNR